mmetsp:Transcript_43116/g.99319  ORF Transcript_43116/g.99319 Transcript_43116/m.99319 type:complete len:333 (-) Transcript_43116:707-1705(-)
MPKTRIHCIMANALLNCLLHHIQVLLESGRCVPDIYGCNASPQLLNVGYLTGPEEQWDRTLAGLCYLVKTPGSLNQPQLAVNDNDMLLCTLQGLCKGALVQLNVQDLANVSILVERKATNPDDIVWLQRHLERVDKAAKLLIPRMCCIGIDPQARRVHHQGSRAASALGPRFDLPLDHGMHIRDHLVNNCLDGHLSQCHMGDTPMVAVAAVLLHANMHARHAVQVVGVSLAIIDQVFWICRIHDFLFKCQQLTDSHSPQLGRFLYLFQDRTVAPLKRPPWFDRRCLRGRTWLDFIASSNGQLLIIVLSYEAHPDQRQCFACCFANRLLWVLL